MASFDGVYTRYLLRTGTVEQRTGSAGNRPVPIRMRYVGSGKVTSVTTAAGTLVTVSAESTGTVTKTYTFASDSPTIRTLIANINADGLFQAKVLDALLSDVTPSLFVTGAIASTTDSNGVVSWDLTVDPNVQLAAGLYGITTCLTGNREWDTNWFNAEKVGSHRAVLQELDYYASLGGAADNLVRIYIRRGTSGQTETQKFGALSVSGTLTNITFASGVGMLSGKDGDEIVCRVQDGTSISDTALFIRAVGYLE